MRRRRLARTIGFGVVLGVLAMGAGCGGSTAGEAGSGAPGDGGAADGGAGARCPASLPRQYGACLAVGFTCEYPMGADPYCTTSAQCTGGGGEWSTCERSGNPPGCPADIGSVPQGQTCSDLSLECDYALGRCGCSAGAPPGVARWRPGGKVDVRHAGRRVPATAAAARIELLDRGADVQLRRVRHPGRRLGDVQGRGVDDGCGRVSCGGGRGDVRGAGAGRGGACERGSGASA